MVKRKNGGANSTGYLTYEPDYAVPPGETLLETIEKMGMTQSELAERTGRPKKTINEIIKGKAAITSETARQLERVLGIPANFWNNLEQNYREKLAEIEERKRLQLQVEWLNEIPLKAMIKHGWVKSCSDIIEQLQEVLNYFGVATVEAWKEVWKKVFDNRQLAFRKSNVFESESGAIAAWIRKGQIDSQNIKCNSFNSTAFKRSLQEIRSITNEPPEIFINQMRKICAEAGVAVVFVPELPKSRVCGAAYWVNPDKAVIQLSLRYKTNDHLWFTFFHEAGHVLQNQKREVFLEFTGKLAEEEKANRFASEALIPSSEYKDFVNKGSFSAISVERFAKHLGIAPGIIVGRLQHDKHLPYSHLNNLKIYFKWAEEA
ncbi:HigA protein [Desulfocucumis palustris]|uniref:HigA protein n=1 Tax=Desulfocucumis palustris TaxID=1898651 RepID=A0A2L2XKK4_9FIRM|nr:HigA family addiction module antitoxin [Desulfocucumis palustris]GBF34451.1 HigA protein [Desulfocucumis palustris]